MQIRNWIGSFKHNRKILNSFFKYYKITIQINLNSLQAYLVQIIRPDELVSLLERRDYCGITAIIYAAKLGDNILISKGRSS